MSIPTSSPFLRYSTLFVNRSTPNSWNGPESCKGFLRVGRRDTASCLLRPTRRPARRDPGPAVGALRGGTRAVSSSSTPYPAAPTRHEGGRAPARPGEPPRATSALGRDPKRPARRSTPPATSTSDSTTTSSGRSCTSVASRWPPSTQWPNSPTHSAPPSSLPVWVSPRHPGPHRAYGPLPTLPKLPTLTGF